MKQIAWNSPAQIVAYGNAPTYTGTLLSCLRYWRDEMSSVRRVTCLLSSHEPINGKSLLEPEDIFKLIAGELPTIPQGDHLTPNAN